MLDSFYGSKNRSMDYITNSIALLHPIVELLKNINKCDLVLIESDERFFNFLSKNYQIPKYNGTNDNSKSPLMISANACNANMLKKYKVLSTDYNYPIILYQTENFKNITELRFLIDSIIMIKQDPVDETEYSIDYLKFRFNFPTLRSINIW